MNHIKNIEIKNFKSIRHQTIEDCRRVNVFIGYPNVGKSNILEAIGLLTFIRQQRPRGLDSLVRFERFAQIFNYFRITEQAIVNFNKNYSFTLNYFDEKEIILRLSDKSTPSTYLRNPDLFGLRAQRRGLSSGRTNDIDDFSGRFEELQNFNVKPYKFSSKIFNEEFSALELRVPVGENMFEVISNNPELTKQFSDLLKPYNISLIIDQSTSDIKINIRKEGDVFYSIPISMIADTLIRLIFFKTAIYSNQNSILLFEEPEAHMFPPYVKKFTSDVIFDETNQFFIATHSPYVLSEFIEEAAEDLAVYIVDYDKGETIIKRLTENEVNEVAQYGIDLFFNLESYLDKNVQSHGA